MDPPTLNVPTEICISMQAGLVKDNVKVDTSDLTLRTLKEYACNFIDRKVNLSPLHQSCPFFGAAAEVSYLV